MIRDPSDGTVKEKSVLETATSGLSMSRGKSDEIQRLNESRQWLKNYHAAANSKAGTPQ